MKIVGVREREGRMGMAHGLGEVSHGRFIHSTVMVVG